MFKPSVKLIPTILKLRCQVLTAASMNVFWKHLWNIGQFLRDNTAQRPRRQPILSLQIANKTQKKASKEIWFWWSVMLQTILRDGVCSNRQFSLIQHSSCWWDPHIWSRAVQMEGASDALHRGPRSRGPRLESPNLYVNLEKNKTFGKGAQK
jgi:hypothetical protein